RAERCRWLRHRSLATDSRGSTSRQVLVDELHGHGALADGRGDPLHRSVADVAGREHPRHTGLQPERPALDVPVDGPEALFAEVRTGVDVASGVTGDAVTEPAGARCGADEHALGRRFECLRLPRVQLADLDVGEALFTAQLDGHATG